MVSWLKATVCTFGLASILLSAGVLSTGCKQGENEVCQVNDDCAEGLQCNANTGRCQSQVQNTPDAAPRPDAAATPDAAPDAMPDAAPDAMPDAAPAVDALPN